MGSKKVKPVATVAPKTRTIVPTVENLLLKKLDQADKSGGIFIPETVDRAVRMDYMVMAIGAKVQQTNPSIKIGSRVIIKKNHGQDITLDGFDYLLIKSEDVIGVWIKRKKG